MGRTDTDEYQNWEDGYEIGQQSVIEYLEEQHWLSKNSMNRLKKQFDGG